MSLVRHGYYDDSVQFLFKYMPGIKRRSLHGCSKHERGTGREDCGSVQSNEAATRTSNARQLCNGEVLCIRTQECGKGLVQFLTRTVIVRDCVPIFSTCHVRATIFYDKRRLSSNSKRIESPRICRESCNERCNGILPARMNIN